MRLPVVRVVLFAALALCGCAGSGWRSQDAARHDVILISIDGFRADYLDRGVTPALSALAAAGVRALALKPSFPTLTFPNHYTLVTGLYPDHHGIVGNRMVDPVSGKRFVYKDQATIDDAAWWGGEPLWVSVEKQGHRAATMFWPGSDVKIDGTRPSHWLHFNGDMTPAQRVDQLLAWSDAPDAPSFYTLYLEPVDHEGHEHGPHSPQVDAALAEVDAALARLIEGLEQRNRFARTDIVIVSDHGMTATSPERIIHLDDLVDADANIVDTGILAGMNPAPDHLPAIEREILVPHEHMRCWKKGDVPPRLHYGTNPRIPALLCLADDGWIITTHEAAKKRTHFSLGEHGYDNDDPAMRALFVAHGPSFRRGVVVPEFDNVDVYALMAHVIGIRPAPNDGDYAAVSGMLEASAR